jgi:hypothetical protein
MNARRIAANMHIFRLPDLRDCTLPQPVKLRKDA